MCLLKDNILKVIIKKKKWLCYFCNKDDSMYWMFVVFIFVKVFVYNNVVNNCIVVVKVFYINYM